MKTLLVTGGAGFIGSHTAQHYLNKGWQVIVLDNLTRIGSAQTLDWLRQHPNSERLDFVEGDIRDYAVLAPLVARADVVLHAAGQTAVTKSVADPRADFDINALGTLNVLEAARESQSPEHNPVILYTSTNKVYGGMEEIRTVLSGSRYTYIDRPNGIGEDQPLDFHSPYGCSKGAGDQYMRDYARIFGLKTIVLRQSCIYGVWQFGTEDQGWLAHFIISAVFDWGLTIYGDGRQVRDALYIDDLVNAYDLLITNHERSAGHIFNIGGGAANAISLLELITLLDEFRGRPMRLDFDSWRPGDQRVFISDTNRLANVVGWEPGVNIRAGARKLYDWANAHREMLLQVRG